MENKNATVKQILALTLGEALVSVLICLVYFLIGSFSPKVLFSVLLGSAVTVLNFLFLTVSVNRAVDKYLALRGNAEMDEDEADKFAKENAMAVQNAATRSYIIRTVSMLAALAVAFWLDCFDPLATAIPLFMFRPILYALELIKNKRGRAK